MKVRQNMGKYGKRIFCGSFLIGALMLCGNLCFAGETTNVYVVNNVSPNYSSGYGYGSTMCTYHGGICTNGHYIMSSSRVTYSQPMWKRATLREKRLASSPELAGRI